MKLDPKKATVVFLVDQSGSMSGSNMRVTKDALDLFLKSLPFGCKFDIVSFGSSFDYIPNPNPYLKENQNNKAFGAKIYDKIAVPPIRYNEETL